MASRKKKGKGERDGGLTIGIAKGGMPERNKKSFLSKSMFRGLNRLGVGTKNVRRGGSRRWGGKSWGVTRAAPKRYSQALKEKNANKKKGKEVPRNQRGGHQELFPILGESGKMVVKDQKGKGQGPQGGPRGEATKGRSSNHERRREHNKKTVSKEKKKTAKRGKKLIGVRTLPMSRPQSG